MQIHYLAIGPPLSAQQYMMHQTLAWSQCGWMFCSASITQTESQKMIGITFLKRSALGCEMSGKTSCWSCNYCYDFDAKKCPACGMSNANVNIDAAESEQKLLDRIAALEESERRLREALTTAQVGLQLVADLIDESTGVAGLHLNGDLTPWDELRNGGRFDSWLFQFDAALNDVNKALAATGIEVK